ncbi:MAG: hypothetical protein COX89_00090 [Candidatus Nealsonbacteria bacterium CG_4_10_14_0_2_um_filter_37_10]|uniref:Aminotransferase n=3 Tax=Candidatus Nealsoniibacteriota TaxID=1817911 RepID=A0A2H0TJB0_9BACT|nr:MAG: hypothetical protein COU43_01385 [Candidatus Nealsonbacteria bacterium CG10_big_fil_rev_8_21_14_0_10_37_25]PIZ89704.1 MAG: hypothetical protein COX89_00090 [Candidatus Nealsonbacteria bacterium CG_4_10_14_0_2_um_filter_37_10]PJA84033.1 MAG: hypothetical protein CO145_02700 [Candidatus Nealsonbacteria bacterium CG_4_9_14_3_um_filter_37_13]
MKSLLSFFARAKKMAAQGKKVLGFTLTSPEFEPPAQLKKYAASAYKYSFPYLPAGGDFQLRQRIADFYSRSWGKKFNQDNVFVGAGGKEVIFVLLSTLLEQGKQGQEVIIVSPYWATYPKVVDILGGKKVFIRTSDKNNFALDVDKIEKAITKKTKTVIINTPGNPSGQIIPEDKIRKLAFLAKKKDVIILFDEVYEAYDYEGLFVSALKHFNKNVFCVFSASKSFSLCGWRVGWGIGDKELVKKMINIQSEITTSPNAISQLALKELFSKPKQIQEYLVSINKKAKMRRNLAVRLFKKNKVDFVYIQGGIAIFVKIPDSFKNAFSFAEKLLEEQKVSVAPGEFFGWKNYFRMNLASSPKNIREGIKRIANYYK